MSRPEYTMWSHAIQATSTGSTTPLNLAATVGNYVLYAVGQPIKLNRVTFTVTTAVTSGSVAGQVAFYRLPTYGATTNSVLIGTITVPTASSVGQVIYNDFLGEGKGTLSLNAGEQLLVKINVQAVDSGTAAGAGYIGFSFEPNPDSVGNQTNMVISS